jgi:GNAT superfamily N-acetyltransferase
VTHDPFNIQNPESLERYLWETAKGHLPKGVSITRVMVERSTRKPKPILGYFILTSTLAKAGKWPGIAKSLSPIPVPIVLLGRLAVAEDWQGRGIAVDPADEKLVTFYGKYGIRRVEEHSLRMFLPLESLC